MSLLISLNKPAKATEKEIEIESKFEIAEFNSFSPPPGIGKMFQEIVANEIFQAAAPYLCVQRTIEKDCYSIIHVHLLDMSKIGNEVVKLDRMLKVNPSSHVVKGMHFYDFYKKLHQCANRIYVNNYCWEVDDYQSQVNAVNKGWC